MHTAALVGMDGAIDWFCYPRFDSPSVFASVLDQERGGRFQIAPSSEPFKQRQFYWPDTNVLVTRFSNDDGAGQIVDFMPVDVKEGESGYHWIVRKVVCVQGKMRFALNCQPSFNYGQDEHRTERFEQGARFSTASVSFDLDTTIPLTLGDGSVQGEFELCEGEQTTIVFRETGTGPPAGVSDEETERLFELTIEYWHHWLSQCKYKGRWREMVHRSALALKLMTYEPTGAIVAAPTCSLPESIGGERNWDYRYTWIRDAAFTLYALIRIGFTSEAASFMKWLEARCHERGEDGTLQIMYAIDGGHELTEATLPHFEGYRKSGPVRIGNGAYDQLQLDIYGELMDSVYLYNKYGEPISYDLWTHLRSMLNWVCENWQTEDEGIWEVRGGRRRFTYSALMCWVALDRGLRLADKRSFPADRSHWRRTRDQIYEVIMDKGWNEDRGAFVQSFGSDVLDASNLVMPLVYFCSPSDPRMLSTLEEILKSPADGGLVSNGLVFRYDVDKSPDGLGGDEGAFNLCTFWLVEALTRAGKHDRKQLRKARLMFEQMLGYSNHLGLFAEETGSSGEALGNFPQAFTHLALISAAFNLDRVLGNQET